MGVLESVVSVDERLDVYVVDYLAGRYSNPDNVRSEYRLLCSGELYNGRIRTLGDWRKTDANSAFAAAALLAGSCEPTFR